MLHARAIRFFLLACAFGAGASGCLPGDDEMTEEPEAPSCALPFDGADLEGRWTLIAHGQRTECEDRRLEGALTIRTEDAIEVVATPSASAGDDPYDLALSVAGEDITLEGDTEGACLSLRITEALPDGDELVYDLDGFITGNGVAEGELSGRGPETCMITGTFQIDAR